ncbi:MAG: hypothetical protein COY58_09020 [Gammaproteobacteria bacterium CG_4_10_14_0_8_um_filter_38_16]|nr:MAG: hypothetical protein COY58_09020 [Gammaproteobacteria bacterium CG_4_10_14_0_8_um_filter_38_16]PJA03383.1 MAG: hypothetical protein COX72_05455 [Gammaproteobacteria bacterium CG_4_10_14_0_2_um_filter_38_22]PJB11128.1 MAG: hypothetical protein CO120_01275 [Gammaproteobacteria bacterium CG_4_9_14_3_um_filter_38_9]
MQKKLRYDGVPSFLIFKEKNMLKKKLLAVSVGVALSMTTLAATADEAGLTLSSQNAPHQIIVTCNGTPALKNIPANGSLPAFPWGAIYLMFHLHNNLKCVFTLNQTGTVIGKADLTLTGLTGKKGEISNIHDLASGYSVSVTPGTGQFYPGTTVALSYS